MDQPLTQFEVEKELKRLADELGGEVLDELAEVSKAAAQAEATFKVGYAKAVLTSEYKTLKDREYDATVKTEDLLFQMRAKEALVRLMREKCAAYRSSIDALRTIAANVREQVKG